MKKLCLLILTSGILSFASAQVCVPAYDTATGKVIGSGGNNYMDSTFIVWNHSVQGNNRLLVVQVAGDVYSDSVTFAGAHLIRLDSISNSSYFAEMWYMVNPPSGIHPVRVDFPPGTGTFNPAKSAYAISFTNVDGTNPFGTTANNTGNTCPTALQVNSNTNELVLDMIVKDYFYAVNPDASQTKLYDVKYSFANAVGGSLKPGTGPSVTMSWSWSFCNSSTDAWAALGVSIKPFCVTTANDEINSEEKLIIFPNPSFGYINYNLKTDKNSILHFSILDLTGRTIMMKTLPANGVLDISELDAGLYFMQAKDENQLIMSEKIIVNK